MISIIIPTYDRPNDIRRTVNSILSLNITIGYEILIINDKPKSIVANFENAKIIVINNEENLGRSKSRNKGANLAKGDILFFIDDDIEVKENLFVKHIQSLKQNYDAAFSNVVNVRTDGKISHLNNFLNTRGANKKDFEKNFKSNYFTSAFCSIKRDFFDKIGKFDENFSGYGWEDPELGLRIERNSGKIKFLETDKLIHYHDKSIDEWVNQLEMSGANFRYILDQYPGYRVRFNYDFLTSWKAKIIFNPVNFAVAKIKAKLFGNTFNYIFFRYLFAGAIYRSLKK